MSLENPRSIVGQTILLFNSLHNLVLMISRCNWFLGIAFLTAAFGALMNPPPYITISLLFFLVGLLLLPSTDKLTNSYFNWQIKGGTKATVILTSLIIICLIVPQVETNRANFISPIEILKNQTRLS